MKLNVCLLPIVSWITKVKNPVYKNYYSTLRQHNWARFNMRMREVSSVTGDRWSSRAAARAFSRLGTACVFVYTHRLNLCTVWTFWTQREPVESNHWCYYTWHAHYVLWFTCSWSCKLWAAVAKSIPPPLPAHIVHDGTPCTVRRSWPGFRKSRSWLKNNGWMTKAQFKFSKCLKLWQRYVTADRQLRIL